MAALVHVGAYDGLDAAHAALGGWLGSRAIEPSGNLQERYLVSPADAADPTAWRTEVGWLLSTGTTDEETL